jgi:hypothetical protein
MPIVFDPGVDDSGLGQDGTALDEAWVLSFIAAINAAIAAGGAVPTLPDTDASHNLTLAAGSNLTANRTLTLTTGDASRTITINGNTVLNDWFDQAVKTTSAPSFAGVTLNGKIDHKGEFAVTDSGQVFTLAAGLNHDKTLNAGVTSISTVAGAGGSTLTGMTGGYTGRIVIILNVGSGETMTVAGENAGSIAANRFGAGVVLLSGEAAMFMYNSTRWRRIG